MCCKLRTGDSGGLHLARAVKQLNGAYPIPYYTKARSHSKRIPFFDKNISVCARFGIIRQFNITTFIKFWSNIPCEVHLYVRVRKAASVSSTAHSLIQSDAHSLAAPLKTHSQPWVSSDVRPFLIAAIPAHHVLLFRPIDLVLRLNLTFTLQLEPPFF